MGCFGTPGSKLRAAAVRGDLEEVRFELDKWPPKDPSLRDEAGATPLVLASNEGHLEVACCLLHVGVDVDAKTNVRPAFAVRRRV